MMGDDLIGTAVGLVLFPLIMVIPGYVAGWSSNVLDFRGETPVFRLALALALSVAVCPVFVYLLARTGSFIPVWGALGAVGLAFLAVAGKGGVPAGIGALLRRRWVVPLALLWVAAAYLDVADFIVDGTLSRSILINDYAKHVAVTDAITRTGLPPANPSLYPGEPITLFYYYFWFLLCSLVDQMGGALVGPRHAVYAGTIWGGFAFAAAYLVLVRRFALVDGVRPAYGIALLLLLVTGLDLVPNIGFGVFMAKTGLGPGIQPDLEWWNEQVSAWPTALLWVPHHVGALTACLIGFLAVLPCGCGPRNSAVAAAAFASAAGMSVWVTLAAAAGYAVWMAVRLIDGRRAEVLVLAGVGALALLLAAPFLIDTVQANRMEGTPFALAVREFWPLTRSVEWYGVDLGCGGVCKFILLPVNYGLELGFFAVTAFVFWSRRAGRGPLADEERLFLVLALAGLMVATFVRASIHNNDLAWRGFMFAQVALTLWAVPVTRRFLEGGMQRGLAALLAACLALGLLGTAAAYARTRIWPYDAGEFTLRRTYEWIHANTPRHWIVQHNPAIDGEFQHPMYLHRQVAVG